MTIDQLLTRGTPPSIADAVNAEWKGVSEDQMKLVQARFANSIHKTRIRTAWQKVNGLQQVAAVRKVPEKSAYPLPVTEFSWEYWFNYFWNEIPDRTAQTDYYLKISPADGQYRREADIPDIEKRQLLRAMMEMGFEPFQITDALTKEQMYASMVDQVTALGQRIKGYGLQNEGMKVVFRGDGRPPGTIRSQQGTSPQTRVPGLAASRSFDKPWHPWNDPGLANKVYFRKGPNQDNCLFSAISVSPEFHVATKFPLLDELLAANPAAVGMATVQATPLTAAAPGSVSAIRNKFESLATDRMLRCSRTNVYVVKIKRGWNTEAKQAEAFPERAFQHLRWIDHFAILKVIRIHFSEGGNAGHLVVIEDAKILQEDVVLTRYLGHQGTGLLKQFLKDEAARCKLKADGTGGFAYTPPGVAPILRIDKVKSFRWNV